MSIEIPDYEDGLRTAEAKLHISHKDGVSWWDAPKPRRWHRCKTQTSGIFNGHWLFRCACGAASYDQRYWMERNSK